MRSFNLMSWLLVRTWVSHLSAVSACVSIIASFAPQTNNQCPVSIRGGFDNLRHIKIHWQYFTEYWSTQKRRVFHHDWMIFTSWWFEFVKHVLGSSIYSWFLQKKKKGATSLCKIRTASPNKTNPRKKTTRNNNVVQKQIHDRWIWVWTGLVLLLSLFFVCLRMRGSLFLAEIFQDGIW